MTTAIHPSATIGKGVQLGSNIILVNRATSVTGE